MKICFESNIIHYGLTIYHTAIKREQNDDCAEKELMSAVSRVDDPRSFARSNVFLAAALEADGESHPVRLRNISARGALLDGARLPSPGATVRLLRGRLDVCGEVAWQAGSFCGLRFDIAVEVEDWVRRVEHLGQLQVDRIIAQIRLPKVAYRSRHLPLNECDSLASIRMDLATLCESLAASPEVIANHTAELVRLDGIVQRLNTFSRKT